MLRPTDKPTIEQRVVVFLALLGVGGGVRVIARPRVGRGNIFI